MRYFKHNSIPLEEEYPGINESSFDEYGNYVKVDAFNEPAIIKRTVLKDGERIDEYMNESFLKGFWAQTNKMLNGYDIQDSDSEEK